MFSDFKKKSRYIALGMVLLPEDKIWGLYFSLYYLWFSAVVCKILVLKDEGSYFSQDERSTVQLLLDHVFALQTFNWKPSGSLPDYLLLCEK